jgi:hypothetical protein
MQFPVYHGREEPCFLEFCIHCVLHAAEGIVATLAKPAIGTATAYRFRVLPVATAFMYEVEKKLTPT